MRQAQHHIRLTTAILATALSLATIQTTSAQAQPDTLTPIKHLVVIFQENVSFDHYFATYPNAQNPGGEPIFLPRNGAHPTTTVNGLWGPLITHNPNSVQPFRLDRSQAIICDQAHDYTREQKAMDGGLMDQFVQNDGQTPMNGCNDVGMGQGLVMGYYDGNTVTALWNYAQHFALNDNFFSTTFGPSTLGHLNLVSGQTSGATIVHDSGNAATLVLNGSVVNDIRPAFDDCIATGASTISMSGRNVGDLMNQKGVTWGWFQGGFAPSSHNGDGTAVCATTHAQFDGTASQADYVSNHNPFQFYQSTSNPHHLPPTAVNMIGQQDQANHQYDISNFFAALSAGNLPAVSFLKAPSFEDGHAQYSNPIDEQTYLVNTINAIEESPIWESTAVIITYDDSDGLYDHVMPPIVSPSNSPLDALSGTGICGNTENFTGPAGRCGYGQRLPLLVVSPFARVGSVDSSLTDQTSILRFIENNWMLGQIGGSSFDALSGTLKNMFEFGDGGSAKKLLLDPTSGLEQ